MTNKSDVKFSKLPRETTRAKQERPIKMNSVPAAEKKQTIKKESKVDKFIIVIVLTGIIAGVLYLSGARTGYAIGTADSWSPREYVAEEGDCFVPPQGDPLYDEHYAKNVNVPNCKAFEDQSNAWHTDAETKAVNWERTQSQISTSTLLFFAVAIIAFFVFVIVK